MSERKSNRFLPTLAVLCILSAAVGVCVGSVRFTPGEIFRALTVDDGSSARILVAGVRLPRVLTGGLVGASLAAAGCLMQAVMRSPMASPSTVGVNSGASFAACLVLTVFPSLGRRLPFFAILGAAGTAFLVCALAGSHPVRTVLARKDHVPKGFVHRSGGASPSASGKASATDGISAPSGTAEKRRSGGFIARFAGTASLPTAFDTGRLILSGLAVSSLFGALNDVIRTLFPDSLADTAAFLVGGLNGCGWETLFRLLPFSAAGLTLALCVAGKLDILSLGDDTAASLGLRVAPFRVCCLLLASLLAGAAVSAAGMIGFVGLIVPHIARKLTGASHMRMLPASALLGFLLVTLCDTLGRVILPVGELPVGITLSLLGVPFFLWLVRKGA